MDTNIALWINHFWLHTWIDSLSYQISWWPFLVVSLWMVIFFSYFKKSNQKHQYVIALLIGLILFYVINELFFKHIITQYTGIRIRPYLAHPWEIYAIGQALIDSSFPSSHVASSLVILSLWVRRSPKLWRSALIIAILVGLSRIHNGMHYPSDVLAGVAFGIFYAITAIRASKQILKKRPSLQ